MYYSYEGPVLGPFPLPMHAHVTVQNHCRIDSHYVIKVSDFGLSEDLYAKNYFRQDVETSVKLPVKWMAPESLTDGVFTEKTDVVSTIEQILRCHSSPPCISLIVHIVTETLSN